MVGKAEVIPKANNGDDEKSKKSNQSSTERNRTTKTTVKINVMWHFVADYLEMLNSTGAIFDEEFASRFNSLVDYVNSKIYIIDVKNVLDEYVVYEVEV